MKLSKLIFSLFLAVLWLPATAHCGLEALGVFPVDECCEKEAQGNHRCESGCNTVEDGGFKTECAPTIAEPPQTLAVSTELSELPLIFRPNPLEEEAVHFKARHLPQFIIRTSLPIRGPSFVS